MEHIIEIDFRRCWRALVNRWLALFLAFITGIVAGYGVSVAFFELENKYVVYSEVSCIGVSGISEVPFYAELVKTAKVAQRASELLGEEYTAAQIINQIEANYSDNLDSGIPVIEIGTTTRNPEAAVVMIDAVAEAFMVEVQALKQDEVVRRLGNSSQVQLLHDAKETRWLVTLGVGAAFALVLAALIVLREILALHLTTVKDGLLGGQMKLIGVIPNYKKSGR